MRDDRSQIWKSASEYAAARINMRTEGFPPVGLKCV
jgi:hypothetical protein